MSEPLKVIKAALDEVDRKLGDTFWSPVEVLRVNDWVLRASALKGEFHWHMHDDDELFIVRSGEIVIDTENGPVPLKAGEAAVVPKGLKHKPRAAERAVVLLLEPARVNTRGD